MATITPNMSIFIADSGQISYQESFKSGMEKVDSHNHSGAPNNGVQIGSSGIQDGSITEDKLASGIQTTTTGTTTDAVLAQIDSIALDDAEMITVVGRFTGFNSDTLEAIGGTFEASYYRSTAGNVTILGANIINTNKNFTGTAAFSTSADVGNQTVDLNITGEAGKTIEWTVVYRYTIQGV